MEHFPPDRNFDENFQKKSFRPESELVELLWRDGQVVLQGQTQRRSSPFSSNTMINEPIQLPSIHQDHPHQRILGPDESSCGHTFLEDQETVSWIQYPPDDPFDQDFSSNFFSEVPPFDSSQYGNPSEQLEQEEMLRFGGRQRASEISLEFPKFRPPDSKAVNFGDFAEESSPMTVGWSHCGSNQSQNDLDFPTATATATTGLSVGSLRNNGRKEVYTSNRCKNDDTLGPNATSSSGGSSSGCSFGRTSSKEASASGTNSGHKRKEIMETEETKSQGGAAGNKLIQRRTGASRRIRAAEVHNLSERRRRDRINEKIRALQELIPHCSKKDKASILDEAIDYLKSLQLQLQVMWMGSGMAPMMFNGVQTYSNPIFGMQMPADPIKNPMNLSGLPVLDRSMAQNPGLVCQSPALKPVQFQNMPQNPVFSEQLAKYIGGFPHMQRQATSQPTNMTRIGSQIVQQSQVSAPTTRTCGGGPVTGGEAVATADNLPLSK